jgi:response regulator RpfG family c-di-GMP phosphodiesterase
MIMSDSTPSNSSNLKAKIFWIDDDPNLLALVHQKLKNDFNIVSFLNPFDCLDRIEEESPSLIVIDLQMPNFSGTELVAQIKNHPLMNMVPIACTSSEITEHQKNEIDRLGVEVFLKKPYNFSSLARALNDLLHNLNKTIKSNDKRMFDLPPV